MPDFPPTFAIAERADRVARGFRAGLGAATVALAMLLSGCGAADQGVASSVYRGLPDGVVVEPMSEDLVGAWVGDDERFALVTWGSSSCPPVAVALTVEDPDNLALRFASSRNDPCTADMSATTHEFEIPDGANGRPLTITVSYEGWDQIDTIVLD